MTNSYILGVENNAAVFQQYNAEYTDRLPLPYIDAQDRINLPGNVYIPTSLTSPGRITYSGVSTGANTDFVCMPAGGVLRLQTSACTISSLRFKENAEDMEGSAEPSVEKMRVAYFQMKDTNNKDPNVR